MTSSQEALRHKPSSTQALANLGVALQEQGQIEPAIHCFQQVLALDPDWVEALLNLGVALKTQGQCEVAADCLQKAIQQTPTFCGGL